MSPKNVVFKKICNDKSVGVYMGRRDFVDHVDSVDPVDGVILIDSQALQGRKVFVTLSCTFRYGRDDVSVLGVAIRRELHVSTRQVYPPLQDRESCIHSRMQAKLLQKLGDNAYPFYFEFPDNLPCSVMLQPGPNDSGKQCCVEFEIKAFSAESQDAKVRKRSTVALMIRKVQYAPDSEVAAQSVEISKEFAMSTNRCTSRPAWKEMYYHGETVKVNLSITNNTSKKHQEHRVSVDQISTVVLYSNDIWVSLWPSRSLESLQKVFKLLPLLANNRERRGIALDGKLKHEDTNLASSSIIKEGVLKEVMGIIVSYRVMVKLIIGGMMGSSEIEEEVEFQEFKRSYQKGIIDDDDEEGNVSAGDDTAPIEK
ncbi:S-arrestin [Dissostichus eleginoides]|uniref:S-arrestin n=1 Tax=Dissostichus eleginoides TaxID=100907 RepID=A0AAD9ES86_DISEL|nr:S-arrestin [Dissostichus eleginoides]